MKLIVEESQKKSRTGIRFVVTFELKASAEESDLIREHALGGRKIGIVQNVWGGSTVSNLMSGGVGLDVDDLLKALAIEEQVIKDCKAVKAFIEAATAFNGKDEYEF